MERRETVDESMMFTAPASKASESDAPGKSASPHPPTTGDPRLSEKDREQLLALVANSDFGQYLDQVCSDELLTPIQ